MWLEPLYKTDVDERGSSEFIGSEAKAGEVTARNLGPARQVTRDWRRVSRNTLRLKPGCFQRGLQFRLYPKNRHRFFLPKTVPYVVYKAETHLLNCVWTRTSGINPNFRDSRKFGLVVLIRWPLGMKETKLNYINIYYSSFWGTHTLTLIQANITQVIFALVKLNQNKTLLPNQSCLTGVESYQKVLKECVTRACNSTMLSRVGNRKTCELW